MTVRVEPENRTRLPLELGFGRSPRSHVLWRSYVVLLLFVLSRFMHHGEYLALDLCRQFSDAIQISRFHQIWRLYRCDGQCSPILIDRYTTGQNN